MDSKSTISKKIHIMIERKQCFSLKELMDLDSEILDSMIFAMLKEENKLDPEESTYLQVRKVTYSFRGD